LQTLARNAGVKANIKSDSIIKELVQKKQQELEKEGIFPSTAITET
jgi:hypothetical protein